MNLLNSFFLIELIKICAMPEEKGNTNLFSPFSFFSLLQLVQLASIAGLRLRFASHTQRVHKLALAHTRTRTHIYCQQISASQLLLQLKSYRVSRYPIVTVRCVVYMLSRAKVGGGGYLFGIPRIRTIQKPLCVPQLFSRLLFYIHFFLGYFLT